MKQKYQSGNHRNRKILSRLLGMLCITALLVYGQTAEAKNMSFNELPTDARMAISKAMSDNLTYDIYANGDNFQAENPSHDLNIGFSAEGVLIQDRSHEQKWRMTLTGMGYGTAQSVQSATMTATSNRMEYRWGDTLTEWYVNTPFGLEQGFTLSEPPGKKEEGQHLQLEIALGGNLKATVEDGKTLILADAFGKEIFRYAGLTVLDADGNELPSWLSMSGQQMVIDVDDTNSRYPIVIDPWVQNPKLTVSDGAAYDRFGHSISINDDTIVVGAYEDDIDGNIEQGSIYVFEKSTAGWIQTAKLIASDGVARNFFGISVSVSGDIIIAGAHQHNIGSNIEQGAAYIFEKTTAGWIQTAKLTASDGKGYDYFGVSVSANGDTVAVGANVNNGAGAVYIFDKTTTGWTQTAKLTAPDSTIADDYFGSSIFLNGDTIVAGAPFYTINGKEGQGAVYIFEKTATGWIQTSKLIASDGDDYDYFGVAVSFSGDTIVAGAIQHSFSGFTDKGAAYVFEKTATGWIQTSKLTASDGVAGDYFGFSLSISGSTIVVGACEHKIGNFKGQGAAYIFEKTATGWIQTSKLIASDGAMYDSFGERVVINGSTVVVGAPEKNISAKTDQGVAYIFYLADSDGDLFATSGVSEPVNLPVGADSADEAVDVLDFTLTDGGSSDALDMEITKIILHTSGTGDFSKLVWLLNSHDTSNVIGVYNSSLNTLTFSNLTISVADGDMSGETCTVSAYYSDTTEVTGGQTFILSIDGDTDVNCRGTQMGNTSPVDNGTGSVAFVPGITISESDGSTSVDESGTTDTFTVVLNAQPVSNVVVNISSSDSSEAIVRPEILTFTPTINQAVAGTTAGWNVPMTITVIGQDDAVSDGNQISNVILSIDDAASDDLYDDMIDQTVSVITVDNDTPGYASTPVSGSTIDVGTAEVGASVSTSLQISETGTAALNITGCTISGTDTADFSVSPSSLNIADGGAAQNITIQSMPSAVGTRTATLTVTHNAPGSPATYTLNCTGTATPGYASSPVSSSTISVGTAEIGSSASASLQISETGTAALNITGCTISGTNATDFSVSPSTFSIVDGGAAQDITIQCTPSTAGARTATLTVAHNAPGSPASYTLTCTATKNTISPEVSLSEISDITATGAVSGGEVVYPENGIAILLASGLVWDTVTSPAYPEDAHTSAGTEPGSFTGTLTGLLPQTSYYVRAYVQYELNGENQTIYSDSASFTTPALPGDVNGDKALDLKDAILALKIVAGTAGNAVINLPADVNEDGKIGIEEAVYVLQHIGSAG